MNIRESRASVLSICTSCFLMALWASTDNAHSTGGDDNTDVERLPVVLYWPDFLHGTDSSDGEPNGVASAVLTIDPGAFSEYRLLMLNSKGNAQCPKDAIVAQFTESELRHLERAFDIGNVPLCYAKPIHVHGGVGRASVLGRIEVRRKDDSVVIVGLSTVGFTLDGNVGDYDNVFFSSYLCEVVDDMCKRTSSEQFPQEWKEKLSGLSEVLFGVRAYRTP